ncbi:MULTISPECIES: hypothetical protein [Streptomyces]|uniref:Uncharacterized protein n=1 Tax=Streptomyces canarius TaxID=285453 RepID=A0ABQ3CG85_9ACTN|nr:hypothetical protein [Streptomyces canarius]GHA02059.1 hypothetical protein GCM10010345_02330 [Streptomyces canarius]
MARLLMDGDDLVVRLSWGERLRARRREVRLPDAVIKDAWSEPDWWRALRGVPEHGRLRPARPLGEWRHPRGRDFVALRSGYPAVVVDLWPTPSTAHLSRVAVSVPPEEAGELLGNLRRHRVPERPAPASGHT